MRGGGGRDQISLVAFGSKNWFLKCTKAESTCLFVLMWCFSFYLLKRKEEVIGGRYNLDKKVRKRNLGGGMDAKQKSFVTFS